MKVFLDDFREAPSGWVRTNTVASTIELLETGRVEAISLDYDLTGTDPEHDGSEVSSWLRHNPDLLPDEWWVHSASLEGAKLMKADLMHAERHRTCTCCSNKREVVDERYVAGGGEEPDTVLVCCPCPECGDPRTEEYELDAHRVDLERMLPL